MLTELRIRNFKAWKDTGPVRLAPLTVIFGTNGAGKSSLGHLLLALRQTVLLTDRRRALYLGDPDSLVDLGSFTDCLHGHDLRVRLEVTLGWRLPEPVVLHDPLAPERGWRGDAMRLESVIGADEHGQPRTQSFCYELLQGGEPTLRTWHGQDEQGRPVLGAAPLDLVPNQGPARPIGPPEKFYRFADASLANYRNAGILTEFPLRLEELLVGLSHVGPLREPPKRTYSWAGDDVPDVGQRGERAIAALLSARQAGRRFSRGPGEGLRDFDVFIAEWLRDLGLIESFEVVPIAPGRREYEVRVRTGKSSPEVRLGDVGFGVSQVLPALVQAFHARPGTTVWMEQPEAHLHPRVQAALADAFLCAVRGSENGSPRNIQLVVESHSEAFLMRLQRRIAEGEVAAREVAVYFVRPTASGADLEALRLDAYGEIENWPEDFFGDDMLEIMARTQAALRRRTATRGEPRG